MIPDTPAFSTSESDTGIVFTLCDGQYSGVKYQYGTVSIAEPEIGVSDARLKFTYQINENNGIMELAGNTDFEINIGKVLQTVIAGLSEEDDTNIVEDVDFTDITDEIDKVL
jgi:hypothetical protein